MSWFFKSLLSDDDGDGDADDENPNNSAGVSQDLSAIGESISRQFRGVAGFLAPPPSSEDVSGVGNDGALAGIRSDFAEITGTFKNSLSLFSSSSNNAVSQISKLASDFLQLNEGNDDLNARNYNNSVDGDGDGDGDVDGDDDNDDEEEKGEDDELGITDDVIEFARQISERPEIWIDFPLSLDHLDFDMSDAQTEHASVIEQLVPSLADVRNSISENKSEKQFWIIYFILLLPRLNEDDFELLSTPEIVEARETLLLMLRSKKSEETNSENPQLESTSDFDNEGNDAEFLLSVEQKKTSENPNESMSIERNLCDSPKNIDRMGDINTSIDNKEKEDSLPSESSAAASKQFQNEDDVSFSDLEDDDSDVLKKQSGTGPSPLTRNSSTEGSTDWVRLSRNGGGGDSRVSRQSSVRDKDSEGEESTDWLTVDDYDS